MQFNKRYILNLIKSFFKITESKSYGGQEKNISRAVLNGAKLLNTDLRQANFENAQLQNVDFSQCRVTGAVFTNAKGLTQVQKRWLKDNGALNI